MLQRNRETVMDSRTRLLLEAPVTPTLLRLAVPNVLMAVVQASIGLIETYFVAGLGTDALAGMALVFPLLMLVQMVSAGAVGGGILSAVSRALGAGQDEEAGILAWYAAAIGLGVGLATTGLALAFGPALYALMGGRGGSLEAAVTYSHVVFAGAVLLWLFNSLAAVIRGTGNMALPAAVTCLGALVLVPLSPALIFGWGPLPHLGIVGGGLAIVGYYAVGTAVFAVYLWSGRGVIRPSPRPPALAWAPAREILRVGAVSALVSVTTNLTIAVATGMVGVAGPGAVAGYGTGSRLEYLLVPLVFGFGAPLSAIVGTAIGAGDRERARRAAWTGAILAGIACEAIGLAAAFRPEAWLGLFGDDPAMLRVGAAYLRIVGPVYGLFGFGLALYFAAQGAGRVGWALAAGTLRVVVALGFGWAALRAGAAPEGIFWGLAAGLVVVGLGNGAGLVTGAWLPRPGPTPPREAHALRGS